MLKIVDWYIVRKFIGTFFFMVLIILAVSIVIDVAEKIDDFIERQPPIDKLIFSYYINFCLFYGNLLSPICIFLAVIYFTSRMTNNTEIVALLSGGVSFWRVLGPYFVTALLLAGGSFYLNAYIVPVATQARIDFEYEYLKKKLVMRDLNIHKKIGYNEDTGEETFVYLYSFNQWIKEGYMFSMEVVKDKDIQKKLDAAKIIWNDTLQNWRLEGVKIHTFDGKEEKLTHLMTMDTALLLTPDDIFIKEMRAKSLPLNDLYTSIELETMRGSGLADELIREKFERFAYPFSAIILTLIGFSVSTRKRRGGTPLQIGIGLVIAFAYVLLVVTGQAIAGENMPTWLAVWLPNIIFFVIALFMLRVARK
ncbi:MAG: LptF/LptG family permease [Bacteroidota bacterium]